MNLLVSKGDVQLPTVAFSLHSLSSPPSLTVLATLYSAFLLPDNLLCTHPHPQAYSAILLLL